MKTKQKKNAKVQFDTEERDILASFEQGEWKSARNLREEIKLAEETATRFMRKDARINIRMSTYDLDRIKRIAAHEGLSYQTLIASVLHKYAGSHV